MKRLCLLIWVTLIAGAVEASDVGTTAADFLKLGIGPRAVAMGEAQVGLADDVYATYWNPAGLARLEVQEVGIVHTQYLENINEQYVAYALPHPSLGTFAGSFSYLTVGNFQGYDAVGQPTGSVGVNDAAFGLSYARPFFRDRRLASDLAIGATGKWIQERLDTVTARALASDAGLLWTPGRRWGGWLDGWKFGATLQNVGTSLKFDQESFPLPRSLSAGLSYTGSWLGELMTLAVDGRRPAAGPLSMRTGLEVWTLQTFVLRTGYTSQGDLGSGFRVGGGVRFKTIQVDYAFAEAGAFGLVHRFGVTLQFGRTPQDPQYLAQQWYEKGMRDFRKGRYTEALVKFNKALEIDPSHPDALRMMKKTYEDIKTMVPD